MAGEAEAQARRAKVNPPTNLDDYEFDNAAAWETPANAKINRTHVEKQRVQPAPIQQAARPTQVASAGRAVPARQTSSSQIPSGPSRSQGGPSRSQSGSQATVRQRGGPPDPTPSSGSSNTARRLPKIPQIVPPPGQDESYVHYRMPHFTRRHITERDYDPDGIMYELPTGFEDDNAGAQAERQGLPPLSSFQLPVRRHAEFDDRFFGPDSNNIHHIARRTGTKISLPTDADDWVLYLWGAPEQVKAARGDLLLLLEQVNHSCDQSVRRVGGWIKINAAFSDRKQAHVDNMQRQEAIRKKFRHPPPDGQAFNAIGIFVWPSQDINPQSILGKSFEHLDNVRYQQKVYIVYNRMLNIFRVLGDDGASVNAAVDRIYGVFCEFAGKNRKPSKIHLLEPPPKKPTTTEVYPDENHNLIGRQVTFKPVVNKDGVLANKGIQVSYGGRTSKSFVEWWKGERDNQLKKNDAYIKKALFRGLEDVSYFRGYARMKIFFGKLVLLGYRRAKTGKYTLSEFSEMLRYSNTTGELVRYIGSAKHGVTDEEVARSLIKLCTTRKDQFWPVDVNPSTPSFAEPEISGTMDTVLHDDTGAPALVRLHVAFERVPGVHAAENANARGEYFKPGRLNWLDVTPTNGSAHKGDIRQRKGPVDIKVMDLETDMAYQVEILSMPVRRDAKVYPIFQEFVRKLTIESIPDESMPEPEFGQPDTRDHVRRISWSNLPGMSVSTLVQKTKYRYFIQHTSYVVEITKYETLNIEEASKLYPAEGVAVSFRNVGPVKDARWGVSLWNQDWDEKLSEQRHVDIGCKGKWAANVEDFFVPSGRDEQYGDEPEWATDGAAELLGRIRNCITLIREAQEDALAEKTGRPSGHVFVGSEEFDE